MTAAGPASEEAYRAPNSQPAPMIDPNEANKSPRKPTSRRSLRTARSGAATNGLASSAVSPPLLPRMAARGLVGRGSDHPRSPPGPQLAGDGSHALRVDGSLLSGATPGLGHDDAGRVGVDNKRPPVCAHS